MLWDIVQFPSCFWASCTFIFGGIVPDVIFTYLGFRFVIQKGDFGFSVILYLLLLALLLVLGRSIVFL